MAVGAAAVLVLVTTARWNAWMGAAAIQTTDNATVHSEMTRLSARVSGNIRRVAVNDFQHVKAGELLMEIEPADYDAIVAQATANVAAAQAVLHNLENQKAHQRAVIAQAEAQRRSALARELETRQEQERQDQLLRGGVAGTRQRLEQATAARDTAGAALAATEATIEAQRSQLEVLNGEENLLRAKLDAGQADLTTAQLRQGYTRIVAPFDGVVGARMVQEGTYVNIGTNLIAVVPLPNVYVVANYKETQLTHVSSGQLVDVAVDMFPGVILRGRVKRVSPASGSTFALLPPDNATGNFTKVVQRIPVRIEFDPGQALVEQLRPGMSVVTHVQVARGAS
jgi:membrane fusion protein (multidrug efflux system)